MTRRGMNLLTEKLLCILQNARSPPFTRKQKGKTMKNYLLIISCSQRKVETSEPLPALERMMVPRIVL